MTATPPSIDKFDQPLKALYDIPSPIPPGMRTQYRNLFKSDRSFRNLTQRGVAVGIAFEVQGERQLIHNLTTGPAQLAKEFKKVRRKVADEVIVPELKRQIPNSFGSYYLRHAVIRKTPRRSRPRRVNKKWHLAQTPRVASSTLERLVITVGSPFNWYPYILHNRRKPVGPNPFATRSLAIAQNRFVREHHNAMVRFMRYLSKEDPKFHSEVSGSYRISRQFIRMGRTF